MINNYIYKIPVSDEQIKAAEALVNFSIENHPVSDVYKNDIADSYGLEGEDRQREYRFIGTLGEIIFADFYGLKRPIRSYGAIDGQDHGKDNVYILAGKRTIIDVKTMHRNAKVMCAHYVLDLPAYQTIKDDSVTDCYFHISLMFNRSTHSNITAYLIGFIFRDELKKLGEFFEAGSDRLNDFGKTVHFSRDTYEVMLGDMTSPWQPSLPPEGISICKCKLSETEAYHVRRRRLDEEYKLNT